MEQVYLNKTHFVSSKSLKKVLEQNPGRAARPSSFAIRSEDSVETHFSLNEDLVSSNPFKEFDIKVFSSENALFVMAFSGRIGFKGMQFVGRVLDQLIRESGTNKLSFILDFQEVSWISRRGRVIFDQIISKPDIASGFYLIFSPQLLFIFQEKVSLFSWKHVSVHQTFYQAFMEMNSSKYSTESAFKPSLPSRQKKLKSIDHYTKEELYEQLIQLQQTAFHAQRESREDNEQLLSYFLEDHYSLEKLDKDLPSFVGIHKKLFQAAYKLKRDTLDLESRFDSLEQEIEERQQKLIAHESNLSAILENTKDHIFSINRNYEIKLCNTAVMNFTREVWGVETAPGINLLETWPKEVMEMLIPKFEDAMQGKTSGISFKLQQGGESLYFTASVNPIKDNGNKVEGVSFFARDISEQEARKREVRHQQDLLFSISKNIQEGIFRTTREEGIQYINHAFIEMFGYENEDELKTINLDELYADPNQRQEIISFMAENTFFINKEVKFRKKDGSHFWGLMSSTKLENSQGKVFFDGAIRNVTDAKETRESLKKKNEELDRFVWSTSHDLRAPLVSVLGLIDVARLDANESQNNYLDLMEVSIQRLINFIRDIIDYAQNSNFKIEIDQVDLRQLTKEIYNEFQYIENASRIEFRIIERGEQRFYSDRKRLVIILKNLLSNAINYSDLNKENPFIRVEIHKSKEETTLCVKDNGIGIREDCKDKVFDMFFRATKQSKGSGIGLYIVKETVEKLEGRIELDSTEGKGASFCVHLPNKITQ